MASVLHVMVGLVDDDRDRGHDIPDDQSVMSRHFRGKRKRG